MDAKPFCFQLPCSSSAQTWNKWIGDVLGQILDVVDLTSNGERISVDGFSLKHSQMGKDIHSIHFPEHQLLGVVSRSELESAPYQPFSTITATEPRIMLLGRVAAGLLGMIELMQNGRPVAPDGFRLLHPQTFSVPAAGDPSRVLEQLGRWCDCDCQFCYLKQNPPDLAIAEAASCISEDELAYHLNYFQPDQQRQLFRTNWSIREILADKRTLLIMRELRQKTPALFFIVTNGTHLNAEVIDELHRLQPVLLIVSVNSLDPCVRTRTMRQSVVRIAAQREHTTGIHAALAHLQQQQLPYGISVAAWPGPLIDGLKDTLLQAAAYEPLFIRVNLAGYTRFSSVARFDTAKIWRKTLDLIQAARRQTLVPIFPIPSLYEVEQDWEDPLAVRLLGVVPRSAAARADLKEGDIIIEINGLEVISRIHLLTIIRYLGEEACLRYERNGTPREVTLLGKGMNDGLYGKYYFPFGLILPWSLRQGVFDDILSLKNRLQKEKALVMVSPLLRRSVDRLLSLYTIERRQHLQLCYPEASYLGGNIQVTDMCVVHDFVRAIKSAQPSENDFVIVPASGFNEWGRDLQGQHWQAIERITGITTVLLEGERCTF